VCVCVCVERVCSIGPLHLQQILIVFRFVFLQL